MYNILYILYILRSPSNHFIFNTPPSINTHRNIFWFILNQLEIESDFGLIQHYSEKISLCVKQSTIVSEGFKGGTRGAPIMPRNAVSRAANVESNGEHKWVKACDYYSSGPSSRTGFSEWMYGSVIPDDCSYRNLPGVTELGPGVTVGPAKVL